MRSRVDHRSPFILIRARIIYRPWPSTFDFVQLTKKLVTRPESVPIQQVSASLAEQRTYPLGYVFPAAWFFRNFVLILPSLSSRLEVINTTLRDLVQRAVAGSESPLSEN